MSNNRFKKTQSFSVVGASSDVLSKAVFGALNLAPGSASGTLALDGAELHLDVVSHSPVLALKADVTSVPQVSELNISICICDVCMGNSSINNSAVATLEMVVLGSSAENANTFMDAVADHVSRALPAKGTCFTDTRAATPDSVIIKS
jgi:hypothetical protein